MADQSEKTFFYIDSEYINISDPCYEINDNLGLINIKSKKGKWFNNCSYVDTEYGIRMCVLGCYHESYKFNNEYISTKFDKRIRIDSARCGIFDSNIYPKNDDDRINFFNEIISLLGNNAYLIYKDRSLVTCTGYGDGVYSVDIAYDDDGLAIYIDVIFIDTNDSSECYSSDTSTSDDNVDDAIDNNDIDNTINNNIDTNIDNTINNNIDNTINNNVNNNINDTINEK